MMHAGFRLPPGIDDGAALVADVFVIPDPRLGIDRLADGADQAQATTVCISPATSVPQRMNVRMAVGAV